jgi:hypothetical protein
MLTCHEHYKIFLFCGLSPPLNKSRTVVPVRDTVSGHYTLLISDLSALGGSYGLRDIGL